MFEAVSETIPTTWRYINPTKPKETQPNQRQPNLSKPDLLPDIPEIHDFLDPRS